MVANLIQIEDEATLVCADVITNPLPIHPATHSTGNIPRFSLVMLLSNPAARSTILLNWSSDKSSNLTPAAPDFVEVGEAGVAVSDAMRHQRCVQLLGDVFALVSCQRGSENRQVLMSFQSTEALVASSMPAASSAAPSRHCASASRCDRRYALSPSCSRSRWCRRASAAAALAI
jgi:hypothetical protein